MGDFLTGVEGGIRIDWTTMPTYNTVMAVAAGAGLILVVALGRTLLRGRRIVPDGWALAFGTLGLLLATTGLHMTLTWPLAAGGFAFDNIIFGEPSLVFGVLLLAAALYLWKRGDALAGHENPAAHVARVAEPVSVLVFGMGLASFGIAAAAGSSSCSRRRRRSPSPGRSAGTRGWRRPSSPGSTPSWGWARCCSRSPSGP